MRRLNRKDLDAPQGLPESLITRVTERANQFIDSLPFYLRLFARPLYKRLRILVANILKDISEELSDTGV